MKDKIYFKNLSWPLKTAIVSGWIVGIFYTTMVLIGFIAALI